MTVPQTIEQKRAAFALKKVEWVVKESEQQAKFKSQLVKLPARLHTNGLGQTVAFYLAAGAGKPEVEICTWLKTWLQDEDKGFVYREPAGGELMDWITGKVSTFQGEERDPEQLYRRASIEARALAGWMKRFAEAFIEGEGKDD